MARIRTIKPEAATSASLARCCREARLMFLLMLTDADDEGRLHASAKRLAGALFPHDDDVTAKHVTKWIDELVAEGQLHQYSVGGAQYLHVANWSRHQRISNKTRSKLPPCSCESGEEERNDYGNPPEDFRNFSGGSREPFESDSAEPSEPLGSFSALEVGSRKEEVGRRK